MVSAFVSGNQQATGIYLSSSDDWNTCTLVTTMSGGNPDQVEDYQNIQVVDDDEVRMFRSNNVVMTVFIRTQGVLTYYRYIYVGGYIDDVYTNQYNLVTNPIYQVQCF